MRNHARDVLAGDFFVTVTARLRLLSVSVVLDIGRRRVVHWNVTEHPTAAWTVQQFRACVTGESTHRFVVHDRDCNKRSPAAPRPVFSARAGPAVDPPLGH
jgi:putative transposase